MNAWDRSRARVGAGLFAAVLLMMSFSPAQRGVRLLDPGDQMMPITSFSALKPGRPAPIKRQSLDPIRVAVEGGDASRLSGLTSGVGAFEIVEPSGGSDLVWGSRARQAPQPMGGARRGVKELSHNAGAGEILQLIARAAPPDARMASPRC